MRAIYYVVLYMRNIKKTTNCKLFFPHRFAARHFITRKSVFLFACVFHDCVAHGQYFHFYDDACSLAIR